MKTYFIRKFTHTSTKATKFEILHPFNFRKTICFIPNSKFKITDEFRKEIDIDSNFYYANIHDK